MNAARSHAPADSLKTPVLILGPGLANRLINWGLKNVRDFTKGNALEKLVVALEEHPKTASVIILPRSAFEKNDLYRRALTRLKEDFPLSRILALRSGGLADEAMIDNDKKAGAQDVLWHTSQVPTEANCSQIVTFVVQGSLPQPQAAPVQVPVPMSQAKPATTAPLPATPATTGKTLSTQDLLHQVIAGQAVLQAQNEAIQRRLDQIHGIVSGKLMAEIKELYPQILKVLNFPD